MSSMNYIHQGVRLLSLLDIASPMKKKGPSKIVTPDHRHVCSSECIFCAHVLNAGGLEAVQGPPGTGAQAVCLLIALCPFWLLLLPPDCAFDCLTPPCACVSSRSPCLHIFPCFLSCAWSCMGVPIHSLLFYAE